MTEAELVALRERAEGARITLNVIKMTNIVGRTPAELVGMDLEARRAEIRWMEATKDYNIALDAAAKQRKMEE